MSGEPVCHGNQLSQLVYAYILQYKSWERGIYIQSYYPWNAGTEGVLNKVLCKVFEPKKEVTEEWRKLCSEELHKWTLHRTFLGN
jgi:hypothetical protein